MIAVLRGSELMTWNILDGEKVFWFQFSRLEPGITGRHGAGEEWRAALARTAEVGCPYTICEAEAPRLRIKHRFSVLHRRTAMGEERCRRDVRFPAARRQNPQASRYSRPYPPSGIGRDLWAARRRSWPQSGGARPAGAPDGGFQRWRRGRRAGACARP